MDYQIPITKNMDSVAVLNLLGNTNVRSVTVCLPTTGQAMKEREQNYDEYP